MCWATQLLMVATFIAGVMRNAPFDMGSRWPGALDETEGGSADTSSFSHPDVMT